MTSTVGTSARIPPASAPQKGRPSTARSATSTPVPAQAPRRPPIRWANIPESSTAQADTNAKVELSIP